MLCVLSCQISHPLRWHSTPRPPGGLHRSDVRSGLRRHGRLRERSLPVRPVLLGQPGADCHAAQRCAAERPGANHVRAVASVPHAVRDLQELDARRHGAPRPGRRHGAADRGDGQPGPRGHYRQDLGPRRWHSALAAGPAVQVHVQHGAAADRLAGRAHGAAGRLRLRTADIAAVRAVLAWRFRAVQL